MRASRALAAEALPGLADGTDLVLEPGILDIHRLVDIRRSDLPSMIAEGDDGVRIGALATLAQVAANPLLARRFTAIAQAAASTATRRIRKRATVGNSRHAIFGGAPCYAVHASDLAGALLAFDAAVTLIGPQGRREVALADFFALPEPGRRTETRIRPDELLLSVRLPRRTTGWRSVYIKVLEGAASTFALVGLALAALVADGGIRDARVVFTGVAPIPWRHRACEASLLEMTDRGTARRAAIRAIGVQAATLAHNDYKLRLARALLGRALDRIGLSSSSASRS